MSTIPKPAEREAWLDARRPYVGASDAACLFGAHPFKNLGELAVEKLTGTAQPENRAMQRGQRLEAAVAEWYSLEVGLALEEPEVLYVDPSGSLCATLDRRVVGTSIGVEIKTTAKYVSTPPLSWRIQAQTQITCAELERVELAVLDASLDLAIYPIEPDPELEANLVARAERFLASIRAGEMPEGCEQWASTEETTELGEQELGWLKQLKGLRERISGLESEAEVLRGMVGQRLGNATRGLYGGAPVVSYKPQTRRGVDLPRLRKDHPEIVAEYGTETTTRPVLRVFLP